MQRLRAVARQFNRKYELFLIGSDNTKVITELRINFEITKSMRSYPNLAKIDLYNPNDETIALITDGDPLIVLKAGYDGNVALIFRGKLRNFFPTRISTDRIITMYAGDGQREWEQTTINKTYSNNLNVKSLITEVINTFLETGELSIGTIQDLDGLAGNKLLGVTLSGSSKDVMDKLADDYDLVWSIQDGEIVVMQDDKPIAFDEAILVSQETGMVNSPTLTEIGADVTTLLNPRLLPNVAFKIESQSSVIAIGGLQFRALRRTTAEGVYRAFEVVFSGDTHGTNWYSTARGTVTANV